MNLPFNDVFLTVELTKMCSGYIIITLVSVAQGIEHGPPKEGACLTPLNYRKKNSIVRICQSKCYIACHQKRMYRGKLDGSIHPESISN